MRKNFCLASIFSFLFSLSSFSAGLDYQKIKADSVQYDLKTGTMQTTGKTEITDKSGGKLTLEDAYVAGREMQGKSILLNYGEHTVLTADAIVRDGDITKANKIAFTACDGCDDFGNAWTMHAGRMRHDSRRHNMYFHNFWFDIYGVPVLYSPYLRHADPSVRHRSGIMIPEIETKSDLGTMLSLPVYLTFSDYHDFTFQPWYISNENPLFFAEHRLRLNHAKSDTTGSYTHTRNGLNRWHFFNNSLIELGGNARLIADINRTADKTYLQKYGFYDSQPFLESKVRLELFGRGGYMTAETNLFQELLTESITPNNILLPNGDILPQIHGTYQIGLLPDLYANINGDIFRIQDFESNSSTTRILGDARLSAPVELLWQKITFSGMLRQDNYFYQIPGTEQDYKRRLLSSGYADWEMPLVNGGENWTGIIRPRARLTIMNKPDEVIAPMDSFGATITDSALFSDNRYPGYDIWTGGIYADYGISFLAEDRQGRSGEFFIGQSWDIDTDSTPDINSGYYDFGASDAVARLSVKPAEWLEWTNRFRNSRDDFSLRHAESEFRLGTAKSFISAGYLWTRQLVSDNKENRISEIMLGAGLGLTDRLSLTSGATYSIDEDYLHKYNIGLTYQHPCYQLALIWNVDNARIVDPNRNLDYAGSQSFRVRFSLKMGK